MPNLIINGQETNESFSQPDANCVTNIYEVVRVQNGVVLFAEDHFERFCNSLMIDQHAIRSSFSEWINRIYQVMRSNQIVNSNIRIDHFYHLNGQHDEVIMPLQTHYPTEDQIREGVSVTLQFDERTNPNAKITDSRLRNKANTLILAQNNFESLLINQQNQITEGSRTNVFVLQHNQLATAPDSMVLQGIMRKKVIETAQTLGIPIRYKAIGIESISLLNGMFLTGTSPRVLPVNRVDEIQLNVSHPLIQQIRQHIEQMVLNYIENDKWSKTC
jgi:branched-chain amino acid aminotransferase